MFATHNMRMVPHGLQVNSHSRAPPPSYRHAQQQLLFIAEIARPEEARAAFSGLPETSVAKTVVMRYGCQGTVHDPDAGKAVRKRSLRMLVVKATIPCNMFGPRGMGDLQSQSQTPDPKPPRA